MHAGTHTVQFGWPVLVPLCWFDAPNSIQPSIHPSIQAALVLCPSKRVIGREFQKTIGVRALEYGTKSFFGGFSPLFRECECGW